MTDPKQILVLGIGNYLMGDEGLGVHFVRDYLKTDHPKNIEIVDGGTGGFHLLSHMQSHPINIIIDASIDDKPEGTISLIKPKFASDFPPSLSSHDIGLKDLLESLYLLGNVPELYLFTVSIPEITPMRVELSDTIATSVSQLLDKVTALINKLNTQP